MVYPPLEWFIPPLNGFPLGPRSLSLVLGTETPLAAPFRFHFSESRGWFFRRGSASTSASSGPTNSDACDLGRRLPRASHHGVTRGRDLAHLRARWVLQGAGNPVFEEHGSGLTQGSSKCLSAFLPKVVLPRPAAARNFDKHVWGRCWQAGTQIRACVP